MSATEVVSKHTGTNCLLTQMNWALAMDSHRHILNGWDTSLPFFFAISHFAIDLYQPDGQFWIGRGWPRCTWVSSPGHQLWHIRGRLPCPRITIQSANVIIISYLYLRNRHSMHPTHICFLMSGTFWHITRRNKFSGALELAHYSVPLTMLSSNSYPGMRHYRSWGA